MIKKIITVKNVGRLVDCSPKGDVEFRKINLIYSENGRGKTTIGAILRSLRTNEPTRIEARHTLGVAEKPEVLLRLDGSNATYKNGIWDCTLPDLEIFDADFVNENVFSGAYVDHEHKKNLYRFAVGEQGVLLAKKVDDLDDEIRTKNQNIKNVEHDIRPHILGSITLERFIGLSSNANIDLEIQAKEKDIEALRRSAEISSKALLSVIKLPSFPLQQFRETLAKQLTNVSSVAERMVREHLSRCMGENIEIWVSDGLASVKENTCPFCGRPLQGVELIEAYNKYFSSAYASLKSEISDRIATLETAFPQHDLLNLQKTIESNKTLSEFWKQFVVAQFPDIDFETIHRTWEKARTLGLESLRKKAAAPLETILVSLELEEALSDFDRTAEGAASYNQAVTLVNVEIQKKKAEIKSGNLVSAENDLNLLKNTKVRHAPNVDKLCNKYHQLVGEKAGLDVAKNKAKTDLDAYTKEVFDKFENSINGYLDKFGAGFRIVEVKKSYVGGKPSSLYRISINGVVVDLGDESTSDSTPSFKCTLSEGDKSTLAFAFFLARLDHDAKAGKLSSKLVVFDDPVSSYDNFRKECTQQQILRIAGLAKQVLVLSHDAYFLRLLWNGSDKAQVKTLAVIRSGQNSDITPWDVQKETQGDYFRNYFALVDFLEGSVGCDLRAVARCIRPLLEANLRLRFPKSFKPDEWLGDFIGKIAAAAGSDPLVCLKAQHQELSDINDYSKKYHHLQNPMADSEPISDIALQSYVKRTLKVIQGIFNATPII